MPTELPYLSSYKNVAALFEKIKTAKIPEAVTTSYLAQTLGFKSSGDRALIAMLKTLEFIDASGKPTKDYARLKHDKLAKGAIAAAVRKAYEPLFAANEKAHELLNEDLRGLVAQIAGCDDNMTSKIVGTFKSLCAVSDFKAQSLILGEKDTHKGKSEEETDTGDGDGSKNPLRPDFHYNIQVHLPANGSEDTYMNIFNAIRKVFK